MISYNSRRVMTCGVILALALSGCRAANETPEAANGDTTAAPTPRAVPTAAPAAVITPAGPEMLSTVGLYDGTPLTQVAARQGTFAIEKIDDLDTLTLNGKPTRFKTAQADVPEPVAANSSISLVGVFELPQESVAWVIIIGGSACVGTHVLVGARSGLALPGQNIPGCDDRGTMRRVDDHITFEAGGSSGTYEDGSISVSSKPV
ncbi:hypothetical protein GCM10022268_25700 [Sphingomonas cynarae]|uniref:Lipoprotein n=1 Tax=Sphingomonas cynarae TaxID=930197 RepID=A0ABP7EB15_9SPHN